MLGNKEENQYRGNLKNIISLNAFKINEKAIHNILDRISNVDNQLPIIQRL